MNIIYKQTKKSPFHLFVRYLKIINAVMVKAKRFKTIGSTPLSFYPFFPFLRTHRAVSTISAYIQNDNKMMIVLVLKMLFTFSIDQQSSYSLRNRFTLSVSLILQQLFSGHLLYIFRVKLKFCIYFNFFTVSLVFFFSFIALNDD